MTPNEWFEGLPHHGYSLRELAKMAWHAGAASRDAAVAGLVEAAREANELLAEWALNGDLVHRRVVPVQVKLHEALAAARTPGEGDAEWDARQEDLGKKAPFNLND